jgi:hypothetical protein
MSAMLGRMRTTALLLTILFISASARGDGPVPPPPTAPLPGYYNQPPPLRYVEERRWGLFAIGVGIFGATWVGNMIESLNNQTSEGMIPIAGPFLVLNSNYPTGSNVLLILDGLAQATGVTLAILGLTLKKRVPLYGVIPTGNGVAFSGRF